MNYNIMVCDDNKADMFLIKSQFENYTNITLHETYNGEELINVLKINNTFDIILLDIRMPRMNGLEALEWIKQNTKIPVIMLTTSYYDNDIIQSKNLQADGYIVKPLDLTDFEATIQAIDLVFMKKTFEFVMYSKK